VSDRRSISLEIYALKSGRWEIHANYGVQERVQCLAAAKELDSSTGVDAVCVVRETYNAETNISREAVIYHSPTLNSPPPVALVLQGGADTSLSKEAAPKSAPPAQPTAGKNNQAAAKKTAKNPSELSKHPPPPVMAPGASNIGEVLPRLAMVCIVGLGGASAVSYVFSTFLSIFPQLSGMLGKTMSQSVLVLAFVGSFLMLFIPLMRRFVPRLRTGDALSARPMALRGAVPLAAPMPSWPMRAEPEPESKSEDEREDARSQWDEDEATLEAVEPENESGVEPRNQSSQDAIPAQNEADEDGGGVPGDAVPALVRSVADKPVDVSAELLLFIGECLAPLAEEGRPLDAFNRFGLTLYFCGAGEYLASRGGLSSEEIEDIMCTHMQKLGHTPERARGFCGNIDEYLVNSKYFQMYEAGRAAMARHASYPEGGLGVTEAVATWNEPAAAESRNRKEFVAVLFTDIVGSTALTQERGDDAAQIVVHEHNSIVREALALHGGREIKHTGDGIMATFPQITNAVEGAMAMQQACRRANAADPELGLGLCIGVNAGEPIHEDGDIFGTPVQMAARVLSKAEESEIAVSNLVREMCVGKHYRFAKKGDYDLKGFADPVPIYLLAWEGGLNAPADTTTVDTATVNENEAA